MHTHDCFNTELEIYYHIQSSDQLICSSHASIHRLIPYMLTKFTYTSNYYHMLNCYYFTTIVIEPYVAGCHLMYEWVIIKVNIFNIKYFKFMLLIIKLQSLPSNQTPGFLQVCHTVYAYDAPTFINEAIHLAI